MSREAALTEPLKREAQRLGFDLVGVCPAVAPSGIDRFYEWLEAGYAGKMSYLETRREAYEHPRSVLEGVRSVVMLGLHYRTVEPQSPARGEGRVSRYAWGIDYHDTIHERLRCLAEWLRGEAPSAKVRGVVDTAPLLEREFAQLAGLGWIGKNTMLLNKWAGSWFFLAALLTDLELAYDRPHETDHCGTCRACLDACPTDAFVDAYQLDARRCISYLTIELREAVPLDLREPVGDWVFGCDVCQDVCPWNGRAPRSSDPTLAPRPGSNPLDLLGLFELDEAAFRRIFRATPLWRPKRRGILRNAAIVLGNQRDRSATPALTRGLHDDEPLVRGASAWALGRIGNDEARRALRERLSVEEDAEVRTEIEAAL